MDKKTIGIFEDKIAFILSNDYCTFVIKSDPFDLTIVCEGDCIPCRLNAIMKEFAMRCNKEEKMTFQDCLIECCMNDVLVKEFNRLSNTTLSFKDTRKPIEKMIDEATGYNNPFKNKSEEMQQFILFCFEFIWLPLVGESCLSHQ